MRAYLATYRAQSAAAKAAGEPMVFKVPVLMFGIHGDQWQQDRTADNFERLLSGTGTSDTGSVTELYREMSFGAMELDFDVAAPTTPSPPTRPAASASTAPTARRSTSAPP